MQQRLRKGLVHLDSDREVAGRGHVHGDLEAADEDDAVVVDVLGLGLAVDPDDVGGGQSGHDELLSGLGGAGGSAGAGGGQRPAA